MTESPLDVHDWIMDHYRSESGYAERVVIALRNAGFYVGRLEPAFHATKSHWQATDEGPTDYACDACEGEYICGAVFRKIEGEAR